MIRTLLPGTPACEAAVDRLWLLEKLALAWIVLAFLADPAYALLPQAWSLRHADAPSIAWLAAILRGAGVLGAVAALSGAGRAVLLPLVAAMFVGLSWISQSLGGTVWNYNLHVAWFLLLCWAAGLDGSQTNAERTLRLMQIAVALFYLQSGLSKMVGSGLRWFVDGAVIPHYAPYLGTTFGRWLSVRPEICRFISLSTGLIEFSLPALLLAARTQRLAACVAWCFHGGVFLVFGIGFWQLQLLYPALFFTGHARALRRRAALPPFCRPRADLAIAS